MRFLRTAILALAVAGLIGNGFDGVALGQTDPYPDSVGIYFDELATINELYINSPATVHAYLIATRFSLSHGIDTWGGGVHCRAPLYAEIRGGGVNLYSNGPEFYIRFDVSYPTPLPTSTAMVLADLYIDIYDEDPIGLDLFSFPGGEGIHCSSSGEIVFLHPSVPCGYMPPCYPVRVASINGDGPVMSDILNWGEVKSLFR